jgi:sugar phosphate permease
MYRYVPGSAEEKKLLRKMDLRIVPTIWVLYTLSYLNRANIGNAKTGGLEAEFNMTSTQYSIVLLVFFISYVLFEIPSNLIIARVRPSIYLSSLCVAWGIVAGCAAATQNWSQLAAVRFGMSFLHPQWKFKLIVQFWVLQRLVSHLVRLDIHCINAHADQRRSRFLFELLVPKV